MTLAQKTGTRQAVRTAVTRSMKQGVELLAMSAAELAERINIELLENPVIEEIENSEPQNEDSAYSDIRVNDDYINVYDFDADNYGYYPAQRVKENSYSAGFESSRYNNKTLQETLLDQASIFAADPSEFALYEAVITSLDERGYLIRSLFSLAAENSCSIEDMNQIVSSIRMFDPVGCAASNARESLIVQAGYYYPNDLLLCRVLTDYFNEFESGNFSAIYMGLGVSSAVLKEKLGLLKKLNPCPGYFFSGNAGLNYIIPDLSVSLFDDKITVSIIEHGLPVISINRYYTDLIKKKNIEKKIKDYIQDRINSARMLMRNIDLRRETILRVMSAVIEHQRLFLERGVMHLKPLTMAKIAKETGLHESTVSRAVSAKYIQTHWGVFRCKYFFQGRANSLIEPDASTDRIIRLINDIIDREDRMNPLSDEAVCSILGKAGFLVARRTVAKYRGLIGFPSSHRRRTKNLFQEEAKQ